MSDLIKRPTPVGTPSLDDMPLTQSVPVCEWLYRSGDHCGRAATVRIRSHVMDPVYPCLDSVTVLMCERHWDEWRTCWERALTRCCPFICKCGRQIARLSDAIPTVIPL